MLFQRLGFYLSKAKSLAYDDRDLVSRIHLPSLPPPGKVRKVQDHVLGSPPFSQVVNRHPKLSYDELDRGPYELPHEHELIPRTS
ncbi:hypothetical protein D3C87_1650330 [compost metagenome]